MGREYDGSVVIHTGLETKDLEKQFSDIAAKAENLKKKLSALEAAGIGAENKEYQKTAEELENCEKALDEISKQQKKAGESANYFKREIEKYKTALKQLEGSGKYFGDEEYDEAYAALTRLRAMLKLYQKDLTEAAGSSNQFKTGIAQLREELAGLERDGFYFGDQEYDEAYLELQNLMEKQKEYQKVLESQTDSAVKKAEEEARRQKEIAEEKARKQQAIEEERARKQQAIEEEKARKQQAIEEEKARKQQAIEEEKARKQQAIAQEQLRLNSIKEASHVSDQKAIELLERRKQLAKEIADMEKAGMGYGYLEYDAAQRELAETESKIRQYSEGIRDTSSRFEKLGSAGKRAFSKISALSKKAFSGMASLAKRAFTTINRDGKQAGSTLSHFGNRLKGILSSLLIFNWVTKGFNAMVSGAQKGFTNLMKYSSEYANSVQSLKNAMATLGNSFAAAFAPIIQAVIPYLVQLINWVTSAINALAQLFAILSGKGTWVKATEVQNGYNDSLNGTADAAKKAYGALARFDDLDVLNKQEKTSGGGGGGGTAGGGFEEVPVDKNIQTFADKMKKILADLFAPLKEAWEREGQFVMDSWEYALEEIGSLIKDIGRDFMTVWNQEATIRMFQDILHIIGDIGLIAGNLAHNFREAWNENETGLRILENIRDIFAVVIRHIREAADITVEWSKNLDFTPLLTSIENFLGRFVWLSDFVSNTLKDFYTEFILPLTTWVMSEEGLPRLFNILADAIKEVHWEDLRLALKDLYTALEPYAEEIAAGLIDFIEDLVEIGVDVLNSLPGPIRDLATALKEGDPEQAREWGKAIGEFSLFILKLSIGIKLLSGAWSVFSGASKFITFIKDLMLVKEAGGLLALASGISGVAVALLALAAVWSAYDIWDRISKFGMEGFQEQNLENHYNPWKVYGHDADESLEETDFSWMDELKEKFREWMEEGKEIRAEEEQDTKRWLNSLEVDWAAGWQKIKETVKNLWENIKISISEKCSNIKENISAVLEYTKTTVHEKWNAMKENISEIWENISVWLSEKWNGIKENASEIWEGLKVWFSEFWTGFTEDLSVVWESIKTFLQETWTGIKETASGIWDSLKEYISTKWEEIKTHTSQLWEALKTWLTTTWTNIKNTATTLYTAIKTFLSDTWNRIKENIVKIWTDIKKWLFTKWTEIKETAEEIWEKVKEIFEEKIDRIKEKAEEIMKKFEELKEKVKTVFENVRDNILKFLQPAIDMIQIFIDKIGAAIQALKDWAKEKLKSGGDTGTGSLSFSRYAIDPVKYTSLAGRIDTAALYSAQMMRSGDPYAAAGRSGGTEKGRSSFSRTDMEDVAGSLLSRIGNGTNLGSRNITINIEGETIARLTLPALLEEMDRIGYNVEVLGVT